VQQLVAGAVAAAVVDELEVIEIQEQDRDRASTSGLRQQQHRREGRRLKVLRPPHPQHLTITLREVDVTD